MTKTRIAKSYPVRAHTKPIKNTKTMRDAGSIPVFLITVV